MTPIRTSIFVDAPLATVWDALADLSSHPDWMADASGITFLTRQRTGVGTVMQVETRIGPFRVVDDLEVTHWEEKRSIAVSHRGVVTGTGRFDLAPFANGIRVTWSEQLHFHWRLGGPITALLAAPVLAWVWRRNLRRFRRTVERRVSGR